MHVIALLLFWSVVVTFSAGESRLGKCKDKQVVSGPVQNFDIEKFLGIWVVTMKKDSFNPDHLCKIENWYKKRDDIIMEEVYYEKVRKNLRKKKYVVLPDGKFNGKFILYSSDDGTKEIREIWLHDPNYASWAVEYLCEWRKNRKGEYIHSEHLWVLAKWKDANVYDLMDVRYWFRYTKYSLELLPMALDLKSVSCPFNDSGFIEKLPSRPKDLVTDKQIKEISDKYWDDVIAEKISTDDFVNMGLARFEEKIIKDAAKAHDGFREHPESYFTFFTPSKYNEPKDTAAEQAEGFIETRQVERKLQKKEEEAKKKAREQKQKQQEQDENEQEEIEADQDGREQDQENQQTTTAATNGNGSMIKLF